MDSMREITAADRFFQVLAAVERPSLAIPLDALTGNDQLFSGRCLFRGYSIYNPTGATVLYEFYDGQDTKGTPLNAVSIGTAASDKLWTGTGGILCKQGVYFVNPGATIKGCVYVAPIAEHEGEIHHRYE